MLSIPCAIGGHFTTVVGCAGLFLNKCPPEKCLTEKCPVEKGRSAISVELEMTFRGIGRKKRKQWGEGGGGKEREGWGGDSNSASGMTNKCCHKVAEKGERERGGGVAEKNLGVDLL